MRECYLATAVPGEVLSAREPYPLAREPYPLAREPYPLAREPYPLAREPYLLAPNSFKDNQRRRRGSPDDGALAFKGDYLERM